MRMISKLMTGRNGWNTWIVQFDDDEEIPSGVALVEFLKDMLEADQVKQITRIGDKQITFRAFRKEEE